MNVSDDKRIAELRWDEIEIVDEERGLCCAKHTFVSSGRTTYLFFSRALYETKMASVEGRARKCVRDAKDAILYSKRGRLRISKTVVKKFNPLLKVNISVQRAFFDGENSMFDFAKNAIMNHREGFFKLESSMNLTASEVYEIYRRKDTVEKLIESLKNHINIKPLRVWSEHSVKGILLLGFLAQLIVSMMRFENPSIREKSTKFIIRSLENLTVTHIFDTTGRSKRIFSNFEALNTAILREIMIKPG
jgi:transposase